MAAPLSLARKVALCGAVTALSLLFLYAAETIPYTRLLCCFLAGLFVCALVSENLFGAAWLSFLAAALLGFLLLPSRLCWFFYVTTIGHYGIVRGLLYRNVHIAWLRTLAMVVYCNIGVALGCVLLYYVAGLSILDILIWPPLLMLLLAELAFFVLDLAFGAALRLYERRVRRWLFR